MGVRQLSGDRWGWKNTYETLLSRMLSFNKFFFKWDETLARVPELKILFGSPEYLAHTEAVCGVGPNPILEPFQLGIIVQVPGQQVRADARAPRAGAVRAPLPASSLEAHIDA